MGRTRMELAAVRRHVTVSRVADVGAGLRRITFTGGDLDRFPTTGPDDHVKLFFPGHMTEPAKRDFTPRHFRAESRELDIDFVLHGEEGPASRWALRAVPGDSMLIGGPRSSRPVPAGVRDVILVADPTAFPAAARWVEDLGTDCRVRIVGCSSQSSPDQYFSLTDHPHASFAGVKPKHLLDVVRSLIVGPETYAWAAGEASLIAPVRRWWHRSAGIDPARIDVSGYWRASDRGPEADAR